MALPDDIITKVRQDFSEDDSLLVLLTLKDLVAKNAERFHERILRCLVLAANGNAEKIDKWACEDPRDLIVAAEYEWGDRVRHLQFPFGFHPDIKTLKNWFVGQEILIPWANNQKWKVQSSDIRSLSIDEVRQLKGVNMKISDPNLYVTRINFLCIRGNKEISASKAIDGEIVICYRVDPTAGTFEFRQFK
ncbi:MAG TPA: hypothetical protein VII71_01515, partial [Verrucomicrobiae bacterium]